MKILDAGGHVAASSILDELRQIISEQFRTERATGPAAGRTCYLGPPFRFTFSTWRASRQPFQARRAHARAARARPLARFARPLRLRGGLSDKMIAVGHDGATSICELPGTADMTNR